MSQPSASDGCGLTAASRPNKTISFSVLCFLFSVFCFLALAPLDAAAAKPSRKERRNPPPVEHFDYRVEGGVVTGSTRVVQGDSLPVDSTLMVLGDSLAMDSTLLAAADSLLADSLAEIPLDRQHRLRDTTRYSRFFADTMPLSRMSAISLVVPGFSQLHNKQYWKIPVAYVTLGASIWGYSQMNKPYKSTKRIYDDLVAHGASRDEIDPVQSRMIAQNTQRQLMIAAIYASWVWFVADGAINWPGSASSVKKATTLSTILPGAGQFYNGSYWKLPIVIGGFATLGYTIDWNNRGFQRFKTAYNLLTDGDDTTIDEFNGRYTPEYLKNLRNSYRRNRDLCIILTAGLYILNIIDAHVDAHLKDYDISDDLSLMLQPASIPLYTSRSGRVNAMGMGLSFQF